MSPEDFPTLDELPQGVGITITQDELRKAVEGTAFAMAQQDVRYYLNGLLLELAGEKFRCVATDGHRLSLCDAHMQTQVVETLQAIVPRKGVHELVRLLSTNKATCQVQLTSNHMRVTLPHVRFTSKLIDGRFPDYHRVLPEPGDNILIADRRELREALARTAILSNEKYKGIKMNVGDGKLQIQTHNPDREEAEAEMDVEYAGVPLEVGFNVVYLLDVLAALEEDRVKFTLRDASGGCVVTDEHKDCCRHVVMPMRL
jgi:DNA polymerase-3 subunit beta